MIWVVNHEHACADCVGHSGHYNLSVWSRKVVVVLGRDREMVERYMGLWARREG